MGWGPRSPGQKETQAFLPWAPPLTREATPSALYLPHLTSLGGAEDWGPASILPQGEESVWVPGLETFS